MGQGIIGTPEEAVVKRTLGVGPPADSSSQYTAPLTIYRLCIQFSCNFACMHVYVTLVIYFGSAVLISSYKK